MVGGYHSRFVSFETALAWNGRVPEAVYLVASVVLGRLKSDYSVPLWGEFQFVSLAQRLDYCLGQVYQHRRMMDVIDCITQQFF